MALRVRVKPQHIPSNYIQATRDEFLAFIKTANGVPGYIEEGGRDTKWFYDANKHLEPIMSQGQSRHYYSERALNDGLHYWIQPTWSIEEIYYSY